MTQPKTKQRRRMMHWSCRHCPHTWSTPIPSSNKSPKEQLPDEEHETICDNCLDKMGRRILALDAKP